MTEEGERECLHLLTRIADSLEILAAAVSMPEPEADQPPEPCSHPEDQRISFWMTQGVEDWQCRICNYRSVTE